MTSNDDAIFDLKGARNTLLKTRRNYASALCAGYVRGKAEDAVIKIVEVQNAIEAIDRAIKDEEAASGFDAKAQIG